MLKILCFFAQNPELIITNLTTNRTQNQIIRDHRGFSLQPQSQSHEGEDNEVEDEDVETGRSPSPRQQPRPTPSKLGSAARLPHFANAWHKVTNNKFILRIVAEGYKIQFKSIPVSPPYSPREMSASAFSVTSNKVSDLYHNGALVIVSPSPD